MADTIDTLITNIENAKADIQETIRAKGVDVPGGVALANTAAYVAAIPNTTYTLSKSGSTITLTGSDGSTSSVSDSNTTYTFNGAVSTIKDSNLTASRALISNSSGKVAVSAVTSTELGYLDGVTSAIQTQLDGKATSGHTHDVNIATSTGTNELILAHGTKYALTAGGQSFIFTMPSDSNTHYTTGFYIGAKDAKSNAATNNGSTYLKLYDDNTRRSQFLIKGEGATSVTSDSSGNITISSTNSVYDDSDILDRLGDLEAKPGLDKTGTVTSVKVGSTSYSPASGVVSLPAYPSIPSSLKNPNAVTIQAGGATVSSYDGSAAKTFNIAASSTAGAFTISDGTTTKTVQLAGQFTDNNTTYSVAKYNSLGLLKPAYTSTGAAVLTTTAATNAETPTISAKTTTTGRYYAVEADKNGVAYVNVPWSNTITQIGMVGNSTLSPTSGDIIFKAGTNVSLVHQYSGGQQNITVNATDTTYAVATGDSNGQIKVTPSSGSAYNVSVKGLGSAAYTASTDYAKKTQGVYYVEGNTTGTTGVWTGSNSDITSYYDGLVVNYKIGIAGASTTTLNINGLGAKTCYLRNTTKITTHYGVGTMVLLSYNSAKNAFYSADYDTNSDVKTASGNTSSKIFLIGATTQSTSGQTTYSHDTAYVDTDGCLYSNSKKVVTQDTFDSLAQTVDELPTFDYVDDEIATVTAIANGKTKTYVLSYSPADTSCNGNSAFNSNNNSISLTQTHKTCLIDGTIISIPALKVGDIVLVTETDVPDRWVSEVSTTSNGTTVTLLKMETSKVDLSPYSENTHTHSVPAPTITVTGVSYTPAGTVSSGFTGNAATISVSGTPAGTIKTGTGTANYTPAGTVTVTPNTTTVNSITAVGSLPTLTTETVEAISSATFTPGTTPVSSASFSGTAVTSGGNSGTGVAAVNASLANGVLTITAVTAAPNSHTHSVTASGSITLTRGTAPSLSTTPASFEAVESWSAGTLPTKGSNTTVVTGIKSASFSGTGTQLLFTGSSLTSTGSYTPSGSVSSAWTGTATTIKPTVTASGTTTGKAST